MITPTDPVPLFSSASPTAHTEVVPGIQAIPDSAVVYRRGDGTRCRVHLPPL